MEDNQPLLTLHHQPQGIKAGRGCNPPKISTYQFDSRLKTLKDYWTWDKTKAQRLNVEHIKDIEKQPLLYVAFTCGFRNNSHEVLNDIVSRHISRNTQSPVQQRVNHFEKILTQHEAFSRHKKNQPISFVKYKHNSEEKKKIDSLRSPKKSIKYFSPDKQIQPEQGQIAKNPPKELKDLKKRLKSLPSVSRSQRKSVPGVQMNSQELIDTAQDVKQYSSELRQLVDIFRREQVNEDKQELRQAISDQKKDIIFRYQYKLNVERDNFRRNVKSYMKCLLNYRNESKRQEVRANGIKRFKRVSMLEKVKKMMEEQAQAQARQISDTI